MVGFRNIVVYDYEKINYDIVYKILQERLKDIEDFFKKFQSVFRNFHPLTLRRLRYIGNKSGMIVPEKGVTDEKLLSQAS